MSEIGILILIALLVALNLVVAIASWWRHDSLAARVTRIEANQANALTATECRAIFERLSHLDGRLGTAVQLMQTIQEYLLERD